MKKKGLWVYLLLVSVVICGCAEHPIVQAINTSEVVPAPTPTDTPIPTAIQTTFANATATLSFPELLQNRMATNTPPSENSSYAMENTILGLASPDCENEECLFYYHLNYYPYQAYVAGVARLLGYYQVDNTEWYGESVACDTFIIQQGSGALLQEFLQAINQGNTWNRLTSDGYLHMFINLEPLSEAEKTRLMASSPQEPVEMIVLVDIGEPRSINQCESPVEILRLK